MPAARADTLAAYVHSDEVAHAWHLSWTGVLFASQRTGPYLAMRCGTDGLPAARNKVAVAWQLAGEDLSFCARAAALGFPIFVDTSVKTNHLKPIWLQEADYEHPGEG